MKFFLKQKLEEIKFWTTFILKIFHVSMKKFEKTLIDKQVPEFLFPRTSVPSSPLSLLTVFSLTPFGVRAPAPPHGRPRAEPPAKPPRASSVSLETAPPGTPRARHAPRRPLSATPHEDGRRRASVSPGRVALPSSTA